MNDSRNGNIKVWKCVGEAYRACKGNFLPMIAFFLLYFVVFGALIFILPSVMTSNLLSRITIIGSGILLFQPLWFGFQFYCLQKYRNIDIGMEAIFTGFKKYKSMILLAFLFSLILVVAALPHDYVKSAYELPKDREAPNYSQISWLHSVVSVLCSLVASFVSFLFFPAVFLILDKDFGVMKALRISWLMTCNRKIMIIRMIFVGLILSLMGAIMCFVGIVFTITVYTVAVAVLYQRLCELHPDILK